MKTFIKNSAAILLIVLIVVFVELTPQVLSHILWEGR